MPFRLTGRHVLIGLLAFFGIVAAVNGIFRYLALTTDPGISSENAYRRGIAYNAVLRHAAAQRALGWRGGVDLDGGARMLRFSVTDRFGRPVGGLVVQAELRRPAWAGDDRRLRLAESGPGRYTGALPTLRAGQWEVRVIARDGVGRTFRLDRRIVVQ